MAEAVKTVQRWADPWGSCLCPLRAEPHFYRRWIMSLDPFASIPEHPVRPAEERPELKGAKGFDPIAGPPKRRTKVNAEGLTRELYRKRGYVYGRTETLESHFTGGFGVKKDLFGIVDGIAVGNGEVVFVQATTKSQKSAHVVKLMTGTFKIGNGNPTPILPVVRGIVAAGCRFVIVLWDQPGGHGSRYEVEEVEVTLELLDAWQAKRDRRRAS